MRRQPDAGGRRTVMWWPDMGAGVDFVVFGFGLGAILMLVGFTLRDLGPWLFGSTHDEQALPEFEGVRTTIRKQTLSSIGNAISVAGAGVALVTFSALLAKAEDDLGAIVVGMSLVLATVGVGAWSYDVFRRYRAAMDIVAVQEHAVRQKMAPRTKRRRPKPTPADQPVEQPGTPTPSTVESTSEEPAIAASAEPAPADDELELSADVEQRSARGTSDERPPKSQDEEPSDVDLDVAERLPPLADDESADAEDDEDNAIGSYLGMEYHPESRLTKRSPSTYEDERPVELPPLPEEPGDTLIDEAVRFEPGPESKRTVPSWLFEDLESELAGTGPTRPDDSIDHFHDATPVSRSSALDRLLANEDAAGKETEETGNGNGQPRKGPENRPVRREDD